MKIVTTVRDAVRASALLATAVDVTFLTLIFAVLSRATGWEGDFGAGLAGFAICRMHQIARKSA